MTATIRCDVCGGFYEGPECPQMHAPTPPPPPVVGSVVQFKWPSTGDPVWGVILSEPDEDGRVGISILSENIRIHVEDTKEIV